MNYSFVVGISLIVCVGMGLLIFYTLEPLYTQAQEHDKSIVQNLKNKTIEDCPILLQMDKALDSNIFAKEASPAIKDKINELKC